MRTSNPFRWVFKLKKQAIRTSNRSLHNVRWFEALESRAMLHAAGFVSGYVYIDANADAQRTETDFGIPGIVMSLVDDDTSGSIPVATTMTDDEGFYSFDDLEPGNYRVSKRDSPAIVNGNPSMSNDNQTMDVSLSDDQESDENNFAQEGVQPQFVGINWFFASSPPAMQLLREAVAVAEDMSGNTSLALSIRESGQVPIQPTEPNDSDSPPIATGDDYTVQENQELDVPEAAGVLANDTDPDGDTLTSELVDLPTNGSVTLNARGSFVYAPNNDFSGVDTFTYSVSDGRATDTATVSINVTPAPDNTFTLDENSAVGTLVGQVTVDTTSPVFTIDPTSAAPFAIDQETGELTVTDQSSLDFETNSSFTFDVIATSGTSSQISVTVHLRNLNETAPIATDDAYEVNEDQTLNRTVASGLLANDSDADGDTLNASIERQPDHGEVVLNSDGSFTYEPSDNFAGTDDFTYQVRDGDFTDVGTATIVVRPVNDAPIATSDSYITEEDIVLVVDVENGLLANDSDIEDDDLTALIAAQPSNGMLALSSDGAFTYTPNSGFSGSDSFTYRAQDATLDSNIGTVRITISAINNPPFGTVTPGAFVDPDLLGVRTDLVAGAPPITADHVDGAVDYSRYSNPPTYGPHHGFDPQGVDQNPGITPRPTGIYSTEQPDEDLIHNLEHGHVWISYNPNLISNSDLQALERLVRDGSPNANGGGVGVILTPRADNDSMISLASWARLLKLDTLDREVIRNFVETNRGHSPEGFLTP